MSDLIDNESKYDGMSVKEIEEAIEAEMAEDSLSDLEKLRRDNPTLNNAWEQIKTIRALTEKQQKQINAKPSWERRYFEILEGVETTNEALRDAWDQYYTLKMLITGK